MGWFGGSASRVKQIEQKIEYLPRWRAELLAKAMLGETAVIRQRGTWYFVGRGRLTGKGRSWREALNDARASDAVGCVLNGKR
jgi:hypothetical protein